MNATTDIYSLAVAGVKQLVLINRATIEELEASWTEPDY